MSPVGMSAVTVRAPGKINLSLQVGARRADGFHPIRTVFQAVQLYEEVVARVSDTLDLSVSGLHSELVPTDHTNLAVKAALALAEHTGHEPNVALQITKSIPVAGGMAGGSADAAATLVACNLLWRTRVASHELEDIAGQLGSDVAFCLRGNTALGTDRGQNLSEILVAGELVWVLGLQDDGISAAEAYAVYDARNPEGRNLETGLDNDLIFALRNGDTPAIGTALMNDLQESAVQLQPVLARTLAAARAAGALGVIVSGSGPTVAALARDRAHAEQIATAMTVIGHAQAALIATGPTAGASLVRVEP